jgi:nudix-type nucleoside diphosphatase (YffH/AdpP family)
MTQPRPPYFMLRRSTFVAIFRALEGTHLMSIADRVRVTSMETLSDNWYVLKKATFQFRRTDGTWQTQVRESYDRGNGVAILMRDPARDTVVLVRQFRFPAFVNGLDDLMIEVPAGLLEDADPVERIRSEVEEETGYRIGEVRKLFEAYMSPGSVTEKLHFFEATYAASDRISAGGGHEEEGEDIEVLEVSLGEALEMIRAGRIVDAKTIMLLQYAALNPARSDRP